MKKMLIMLIIGMILAISCEMPVDYVVSSGYSSETTAKATPESEAKMDRALVAIDETKVYIFDPENRKIYLSDSLPDGSGEIYPTPMYYDDGTIAEVIDFNYYKTNRHWYVKVREYREVITDGVVTGGEYIDRIFKQKDGVMVEEKENMVFPKYDPVSVPAVKMEQADLSYEELADGMHCLWRKHNINLARNSGYYGDFDYVSWWGLSGNTLWCIGQIRNEKNPRLFTVGGPVPLVCWMWNAKAVFKY